MDSEQRPSWSDPRVRETAVKALAKEVAEWSNGELSADEAAEDLRRISLNDNGFEIARDLDLRHSWWGIDAELVEILDMASSHLWTAHGDAVKAWVAEVGFEPAFKEGDRVSTPRGNGPVYKIDHDKAQYIVSIDGEDYGLGGGAVIDAERVTAEQVKS